MAEQSKRRKRTEKLPSICDVLAGEGWKTPNSYGVDFEPLPTSAGIYLLLTYPTFDDVKRDKSFVAYVGKSKKLSVRLSAHPIIDAIEDDLPRSYTQRWFLPLDYSQIDAAEIRAIGRFNPPYNIQHRRRGPFIAVGIDNDAR